MAWNLTGFPGYVEIENTVTGKFLYPPVLAEIELFAQGGNVELQIAGQRAFNTVYTDLTPNGAGAAATARAWRAIIAAAAVSGGGTVAVKGIARVPDLEQLSATTTAYQTDRFLEISVACLFGIIVLTLPSGSVVTLTPASPTVTWRSDLGTYLSDSGTGAVVTVDASVGSALVSLT